LELVGLEHGDFHPIEENELGLEQVDGGKLSFLLVDHFLDRVFDIVSDYA
jgi:hypothetical protein